MDVGDYRAKARDALVQKAMAAAEKVRRWGDVVELEPMSAFDRRIIYSALKDSSRHRSRQRRSRRHGQEGRSFCVPSSKLKPGGLRFRLQH